MTFSQYERSSLVSADDDDEAEEILRPRQRAWQPLLQGGAVALLVVVPGEVFAAFVAAYVVALEVGRVGVVARGVFVPQLEGFAVFVDRSNQGQHLLPVGPLMARDRAGHA